MAGSNECPRRSYLDERIADDGHNAAAVKGTLTHNLIQVGSGVGALGWPASWVGGPACAELAGTHTDTAAPAAAAASAPQTALLEGLRTDTQLARAAEGIVGDATESLYQVELSEEAAMETLRRAVPGIQRCGRGGAAVTTCPHCADFGEGHA